MIPAEMPTPSEVVELEPCGTDLAGPVEDIELDLKQAEEFLALLDPNSTEFHFRTFPERKDAFGGGRNYHGTLAQLAPALEMDNLAGRGVFIVVNAGGQKARDITRIRALFADFDGELAVPNSQLDLAGLPPHMLIASSEGRAHV